jgi:hypothetical protein
MDETDVEFFETQCVIFLTANLDLPGNVTSLEIERVMVTQQTLDANTNDNSTVSSSSTNTTETGTRRNAMELYHSLTVTFSVWATVLPGDAMGLDVAMSSFFADTHNVDEFQSILHQYSNYFNPISEGSRSSTNNNSNNSDGGFPGAAYGAVAGVFMSLTGAAVVFVWAQKRRVLNRTTTMKNKKSSYKYQGQFVSDSMPSTEGEKSASSSFGGDFIIGASRSSEFGATADAVAVETVYNDTPTNYSSTAQGLFTSQSNGTSLVSTIVGMYPLPSVETSAVSTNRPDYIRSNNNNRQNVFSPALFQFESNIEVPVTPAPGLTPSMRYNMSTFDPEDPTIGAVRTIYNNQLWRVVSRITKRN